MIAFWVLGGVLLAGGLWTVGAYNALVKLRENVKNGWSQIDVQLKRRHDLIPNLVETAKGYMAHEKTTLENVIKARQQAVDAKGLKDKQEAENFLSGTLRSLFAVSENYPNLKADTQMHRLHEEITSTENRISFARQYYNDEVNRLNTTVQSFPDNLIAQTFHFSKAEFFELKDEAQREPPKVQF
jgi:LemA protein